jgi:hypothetical protein
MKNKSVEFAHCKSPQTQSATCGYFCVIPLLRKQDWELMFLLSQLHFIELTVEISILLRLQKIGTEHWAVSDVSNSKKNFTKNVNNEILKLKP